MELRSVNVQWEGVRLGIEGSLVRDSLEALCCVLEQDSYSMLVLVQPREIRITSHNDWKLLTGTYSINTDEL